MRKICPPPRSPALLPRLPFQAFLEAKGMRKAASVAERQKSELPSGHRASFGMGKGRRSGTLGNYAWLVLWLFFSAHRALTSGHRPSSVLRSPAMGTLGSDFLSSLPLHEYPPAFPLGADIQGRILTLRWRGGLYPVTLSRFVSLQSPRDRGIFFFSLVVKESEGG